MDKILYGLVRWPWAVGVVVFLVLTQLPLGPWYISAMFVIGVALVATSIAWRLKSRLIGAEMQRWQERRRLRLDVAGDAAARP